MHRSGTSLVAMTLNALGLDFGEHDEFYSADQWNQKGYFERRDVIDLNSRIITGFSRTQGAVSSTLGKVKYLTQPSLKAIEKRGRSLQPEVERMASDLGELFVKDPRFTLTTDCWHPHISQIVVCLRRPDQVALSLKRRQRVPLALSYRFWDYHARAILAIEHERVHYVDFDVIASTSPDAELAGLSRFLGIDDSLAEMKSALRSHLAPQLKHFADTGSVALPTTTRDLWEQLTARRFVY